MKKQSKIAQIAIFFAIMLVLHLLSSVIFNLLPVPIKPTIIHIPVIIASILYGPKVGAVLGGLMGCISVSPIPGVAADQLSLQSLCAKWKPLFASCCHGASHSHPVSLLISYIKL